MLGLADVADVRGMSCESRGYYSDVVIHAGMGIGCVPSRMLYFFLQTVGFHFFITIRPTVCISSDTGGLFSWYGLGVAR